MQVSDDSIIIGTAMEERWKDLRASQHGGLRRPDDDTPSEQGQHVFYKDMRFWLILLMLAAFFAFTLVRFP